MAKVAKNLVLHGASGMLGDQIVIRSRAGQMMLSSAPGARTTPPTEAQKKHQQRFQQATVYAKAQLADPEKRKAYEERAEGMVTAYNVAVADFLHAPDIDEIDVTGYHGAANEPIRVRVTDDFKVETVHLAVYNGDGTLVEEGDAAQQENKIDWIYTSTAENPSTAGDKIVVLASDRPGNITEEDLML